MPAEPGKFVKVDTGEIFDAYTDGVRVSNHLTKGGEIARNRPYEKLYHNYKLPGGLRLLQRTAVARYDPTVEERAQSFRKRIASLSHELSISIGQLRDLYDHQAVDWHD